MKVEIKDGKITIDPIDLLSELRGEDKLTLIEALSCESEVIKNVSDQIIHGCTENGWHGSISFGSEPSTALSKAIRQVTESSSDVAKAEIKKLKRLVEDSEESKNEAWRRYHEAQKELRIYR